MAAASGRRTLPTGTRRHCGKRCPAGRPRPYRRKKAPAMPGLFVFSRPFPWRRTCLFVQGSGRPMPQATPSFPFRSCILPAEARFGKRGEPSSYASRRPEAPARSCLLRREKLQAATAERKGAFLSPQPLSIDLVDTGSPQRWRFSTVFPAPSHPCRRYVPPPGRSPRAPRRHSSGKPGAWPRPARHNV